VAGRSSSLLANVGYCFCCCCSSCHWGTPSVRATSMSNFYTWIMIPLWRVLSRQASKMLQLAGFVMLNYDHCAYPPSFRAQGTHNIIIFHHTMLLWANSHSHYRPLLQTVITFANEVKENLPFCKTPPFYRKRLLTGRVYLETAVEWRNNAFRYESLPHATKVHC
jgi:hypothetical protein